MRRTIVLTRVGTMCHRVGNHSKGIQCFTLWGRCRPSQTNEIFGFCNPEFCCCDNRFCTFGLGPAIGSLARASVASIRRATLGYQPSRLSSRMTTASTGKPVRLHLPSTDFVCHRRDVRRLTRALSQVRWRDLFFGVMEHWALTPSSTSRA